METDGKFWGLIEMMGHQKIAGFVQEVELGGAKLLRVDVPAVPEQPARGYYGPQPAVPGWTRYVGGSAVYAITPMEEEACRMVVASMRADPVSSVGMGHLVRVLEAPSQVQIEAPEGTCSDEDEAMF